ncbi:tetratricopeptide repeat protein [Streptomyces sp. 7R007]
MSRLSREKKREQKRAAQSAVPLVAAPIDVRVPGTGPASVGGVPVTAPAGEEIHQTVLNHLHRIALATGHPVHATIQDDRIGYVVHVEVGTDGSSGFTGEPVRMAETGEGEGSAAGTPGGRPGSGPGNTRGNAPGLPQPPSTTAAAAPVSATPTTPGPPAQPTPPVPTAQPTPPAPAVQPTPPAPPAQPTPPVWPQAGMPTPTTDRQPQAQSQPSTPASAVDPQPRSETPASPEADPDIHPHSHPHSRPQEPRSHDKPTHLLRRPADVVRDSAPTFPFRAVSEPRPLGEGSPTFPLRAVPEAPVPGTVVPPTGEFGPPPPMDAVPPRSTPEAGPKEPDADWVGDPDARSTPTPARGFDAVAEAVLGDEPPAATVLAQPMARINEAVKEGRIDAAAALAEQTVQESSATLGPEHPEVLRLRELTAYIAYLAGDPVRAFRLSLDLVRIHRRHRDAEAAYGSVQSAAAAWRAVRDPREGLDLGRDLIGEWAGLSAEDGPAAEDVEQLESARARMARLTARAERSAP